MSETVMPEQMTVPEAARELGVSRQAIWQAITRGALAATKIGRDWLIDRADWERYRAQVGATDSPIDSPRQQSSDTERAQ